MCSLSFFRQCTLVRTVSDTCTWMQPVPRVPDRDAVSMEILLPRPVNFELDVHLPVFQVTGLHNKIKNYNDNRKTYNIKA